MRQNYLLFRAPVSLEPTKNDCPFFRWETPDNLTSALKVNKSARRGPDWSLCNKHDSKLQQTLRTNTCIQKRAKHLEIGQDQPTDIIINDEWGYLLQIESLLYLQKKTKKNFHFVFVRVAMNEICEREECYWIRHNWQQLTTKNEPKQKNYKTISENHFLRFFSFFYQIHCVRSGSRFYRYKFLCQLKAKWSFQKSFYWSKIRFLKFNKIVFFS